MALRSISSPVFGVATAIRVVPYLLLSYADPEHILILQIAGGGFSNHVEHLGAVLGGHFTSAQPGDKVDHGWSRGLVVEGGANLRKEYATVVRRAERVV